LLHNNWPLHNDGSLYNDGPFHNNWPLHAAILMVILMMVLMTMLMMFAVPMSAFVLPRIGSNHERAQCHEYGKESNTEHVWPSHRVVSLFDD
jgi:hypothetical protein